MITSARTALGFLAASYREAGVRIRLEGKESHPSLSRTQDSLLQSHVAAFYVSSCVTSVVRRRLIQVALAERVLSPAAAGACGLITCEIPDSSIRRRASASRGLLLQLKQRSQQNRGSLFPKSTLRHRLLSDSSRPVKPFLSPLLLHPTASPSPSPVLLLTWRAPLTQRRLPFLTPSSIRQANFSLLTVGSVIRMATAASRPVTVRVRWQARPSVGLPPSRTLTP